MQATAPKAAKVSKKFQPKREEKGVGRIAEEMLEDYQVEMVLTVLWSHIQSVEVAFSADGGDSRTEALKSHVESLWFDSLPKCQEAITHGRVAFEKCFAYDATHNLNYIEALDSLPYDKTEMVLLKGEFQGIKLTGTGDLPADKSWWLAIDPTPMYPHGRSRLAGAPFRVWEDRRDAKLRRRNARRRNVIRGMIVEGPASVQTDDGQNIDGSLAASDAVAALEKGETAYFPTNGTNATTGEPQSDYRVTDPAQPAGLEMFIADMERLDIEMIRAFGVPEKTIIEGESVGSFALVSEQMKTLYSVVEDLLNQIVMSFERYVIRKLESLNQTIGRITVTFPSLVSGPDSIVAKIVETLITSPALSPILSSGAVDLVQVLETAGVPLVANAGDLLRRSLSQSVATPAPQQFQMAMESPPGTVPERDILANRAIREAESLWNQLVSLSVQLKEAAAIDRDRIERAILDTHHAILQLAADTEFAGRILGMMSPWLPDIGSAPGGADTPAIDLAVSFDPPPVQDRDRFRYPFLDRAVQFLEEKSVVTSDQVKAMAEADRRKAFSIPDTSAGMLKAIKQQLEESTLLGESSQTFRDRIKGLTNAPKYQQETLYRTQTKQAYLNGQNRVFDNPRVQIEFPAVMIKATRDTRVRDEHWAVDGFVCLRSDPAYKVLTNLLNDYNCRCVPIPLTAERAERMGVKTLADLPMEVRAKYGGI